MRKSSYAIAVPIDQPEKREKVTSAWDKDYDPSYGEKQDAQHVQGQSFADLRDDMNARRRQTARRMSDY